MENKEKLSKKAKVTIGIITLLVLTVVIIVVIMSSGNDRNNEINIEEESSKTEIENESKDESETEDDTKKQENVLKHQYGIVYDDETYTYTCRWEAEYDINGELIKKTYYDSTGYRKIETYVKDGEVNTANVTYEIVDEYNNVKETFDSNPMWEDIFAEDEVEVVSTYYEEYELKGAKYEVMEMEPFGGEAILYNGEVYVDLSGVLKQENKEVLDALKMLYGEDVMDKLSTTIENCQTYEIEGLGGIKAIKVDCSGVIQIANNVGHDIDDKVKNGIILIGNYYNERFVPFDYLIKGSSECDWLDQNYRVIYGVINYEHNGNEVSYLIEQDGRMTSTGILTQSTKVGLGLDDDFWKTNMQTVEVYRHKDKAFSKIQTIVYDENGNVKENIEFNHDEIEAIPVWEKEQVKETEYDGYDRITKEVFESGNYVEYSYFGNYNSGSYSASYYDLNSNVIMSIWEDYNNNKLVRKEIIIGNWENYNIYAFEYTYIEEELEEKDYSSKGLSVVNEAILYNGEVYVDIYDENDFMNMENLESYMMHFYGDEGMAMLQNMIKADEDCNEYSIGELGKYKALKLDVKNVEKIYRCAWGQTVNAETGVLMIHDDKTVSFAYALDMAQGINNVIKLDISDIEDCFVYNFNWTEMYLVKDNGEMIEVRGLIGSYFEE